MPEGIRFWCSSSHRSHSRNVTTVIENCLCHTKDKDGHSFQMPIDVSSRMSNALFIVWIPRIRGPCIRSRACGDDLRGIWILLRNARTSIHPATRSTLTALGYICPEHGPITFFSPQIARTHPPHGTKQHVRGLCYPSVLFPLTRGRVHPPLLNDVRLHRCPNME